jgi:competence protein ComEA
MRKELRRSLWGWTDPARRLSAGIVLTLALALAWTSRHTGRGAPPPDPTLVIDPNSAPPAVLLALPKLGPVLVGRIVAERERQPFESLDDIDARVRGIGPATITSIRPYVRFVHDRPADPTRLAARPQATGVSP